MRFPRIRPVRLLLALVAIPIALWGLVLAVVPTEWAKGRFAARLARATGKPVRLGALSLGPCGGVRLQDLEISEAGHEDDPWLRVDQIRLDLHLYHLLCRQMEPTDVELDGVALRVHRRQDGSFEFGDLLRGRSPTAAEPASATPTPPPAVATSQGSATGCASKPLNFHVSGGSIRIVDEPSATRLEFADLEGEATWRSGLATIKDMKGHLNGGQIELAAQLDRTGASPSFEGEIRAEGVALDVGMGVLAYLTPVVAGAPGSVDGKLDLHVSLQGRGSTGAELGRSLTGRGTIALDPIQLDGSKVVAELAGVLPLPATGRVGSVRSQFTIGEGRIASDPLTLRIAQVPIVLAGWTAFDGRLDYRVRQEALTGRLPREAREFLADLPIRLEDLASLHVRGTLDALTVSLDGPAADGTPARRPVGDRERLKQLGRKALDRLLK